jgi:outer membrane protein assembly factor BamD (BamD/ComL family)
MSKKSIFISTLVTLSLVLAISANVMAQQQRRNFQSQTPSPTSTSNSSRTSAQSDATKVFRSARDLITDGDWARAQAKFDEYVSSYPNEKNLDAALYWMAYAQHKLEKFAECRKTIDRLLEKYPSSAWRDDARVLMAQIPGMIPSAYVASVDQAAAYEQLVNAVRAIDTAPIAQIAEQAMVYSQGKAVSPLPSPQPLPWSSNEHWKTSRFLVLRKVLVPDQSQSGAPISTSQGRMTIRANSR